MRKTPVILDKRRAYSYYSWDVFFFSLLTSLAHLIIVGMKTKANEMLEICSLMTVKMRNPSFVMYAVREDRRI